MSEKKQNVQQISLKPFYNLNITTKKKPKEAIMDKANEKTLHVIPGLTAHIDNTGQRVC
jgi:hypothetical protein